MGNQQPRFFKYMEYRDVVGYEGLYKVSEYGKIIRLPREVNSVKASNGVRMLSKKVLANQLDKYGYNYVQLVDYDGIRRHHTIHRLVAIAFLDNPSNFPSINHIDECKINNHYSNLEWCTVKYNNLYNRRQEKINLKLRKMIETRKPVLQYTSDKVLLNEFLSIRDAHRKLGFAREGISNCCNGKKKLYKGFIWKFKE